MLNGSLLLAYRYGVSHTVITGNAQRISADDGVTWGPETLYTIASGTAPYYIYVRQTPAGNLLSSFDGGTSQYNRSDDSAVTWSGYQPFVPPSGGGFVNLGFNYQGIGYMTDYSAAGDVHFWSSADDGHTWTQVSSVRQPGDQAITETGICRMGDGRVIAVSRSSAQTSTYVHFSSDLGVTWGAEQDYTSQLGILDLPQLVYIQGKVVIVARDHLKKQVVMFSSRDNGATFGDRSVIDYWPGLAQDGGYTWPQPLDASRLLIAYYCDTQGTVHPDIKSVIVRVRA